MDSEVYKLRPAAERYRVNHGIYGQSRDRFGSFDEALAFGISIKKLQPRGGVFELLCCNEDREDMSEDKGYSNGLTDDEQESWDAMVIGDIQRLTESVAEVFGSAMVNASVVARLKRSLARRGVHLQLGEQDRCECFPREHIRKQDDVWVCERCWLRVLPEYQNAKPSR